MTEAWGGGNHSPEDSQEGKKKRGVRSTLPSPLLGHLQWTDFLSLGSGTWRSHLSVAMWAGDHAFTTWTIRERLQTTTQYYRIKNQARASRSDYHLVLPPQFPFSRVPPPLSPTLSSQTLASFDLACCAEYQSVKYLVRMRWEYRMGHSTLGRDPENGTELNDEIFKLNTSLSSPLFSLTDSSREHCQTIFESVVPQQCKSKESCRLYLCYVTNWRYLEMKSFLVIFSAIH